jgi:DNA-binding transcriptional LysR family regulator
LDRHQPLCITSSSSNSPGVHLSLNYDTDLPQPPRRWVVPRSAPKHSTKSDSSVWSPPGHPLSSGRATLRRIAAVDHIGVSRRGRTRGAFDDVLDQHGLERSVVDVVPTFTASAHIIASSQLTGLIAASYAAQVATLTGAHLYEIPVELPKLPISQAWHVRHDLDPAHQWLREQITAVMEPSSDA